ncbi:MAG: 2,4-dihydroxyhept-2-ene-1,7-dioic acid aldolase, partial [Chloroflexota bacterium]
RAQGFGQNVQDYLKNANDEILLITAVETPEAVANLDQILTVKGVDGIFIGPMDLASNMGYLGQPNQPEVQEVIAGIENKVFASGKILATIAGTWEQAQILYERGYQMITLMADGTSLAKLASINVAQFKENFPR